MGIKSILVIGDSVFDSERVSDSMLPQNTLGISITNRAKGGASIPSYFAGTSNQFTPQYASEVVGGYEYIMLSLFRNDFSSKGVLYDGGPVADVVTEALGFVDYLHETLNYRYSKILFHMPCSSGLTLVLDGLNVFYGFDPNPFPSALPCLKQPEGEVATPNYPNGDLLTPSDAAILCGWFGAMNRNLKVFRTAILGELSSRGVTLIDEWNYGENVSIYNADYMGRYSSDGLHPAGKLDNSTPENRAANKVLVSEWTGNLMELIKTAIKEH